MTEQNTQKYVNFWQAMINKYEGRNSHVEQQQIRLPHRMTPKQCSVPLITTANRNTFQSPIDVMKFMLERRLTDVTTVGSQSEMIQQQTNVDSNSNYCSSPPRPNLETDLNLVGLGDPCMASEIYDSSLSPDFQCLSKIQELTIREKQMKHQMQEMEQREQAYIETLQHADEMWANMEKNYEKQLSNVQQNEDASRFQYEQINERLLSENAQLNNELNDLKLELRECVENVQGPISRELEKERQKAEKLEMDLTTAAKAMVQKECASANEMKDLQEQINSASINLCDLKATNEQLQHEMGVMQCKYGQLQKDLINQKISEARTLKRLNEGVHVQQTPPVVTNKEYLPMEPEDEGLYATDGRCSETFLPIDECVVYKNS